MSAGDPEVPFGRSQERSVRVRVAQAALQAALGVPGVLGSDSGSSGGHVTADPDSGPLIGVLATAQSDGHYAVDLSLVAGMVSLPALAEEVRARVRSRVDAEQLGDALGPVNVEFARVVTPEEFAATTAEQEVEEAIVAEELAAAAATAEEAAEVGARGAGSVEAQAAETVAVASALVPPVSERRLGTPAAEEPPRRPGPVAALAAREAALASDQAALAAKQAALAAEQAALAAERAALAADPGPPLQPLDSEHTVASAAEEAGERNR